MTDRRRKHDDDTARRVSLKYASGTESVRQIATSENIPVSTVYGMLKRVGMEPTRKPDIGQTDDAATELYEIITEQELLIDLATAEAHRLRSVLDRDD